MEVDILSRIQFAITAGFHFLFPPITIGLALFIVFAEALWVKTANIQYRDCAKFFLKLFSILFAMGVATGMIMVFQFGTNWPVFSTFVGDVFGSPLAIEAVFAFFMESIFLGLALFAWDKLSPKKHFFCTLMVCIGTHLSAIWILVANSFMQTPAGFEIAQEGVYQKAIITDFWAMVFSPSSMDRLFHTLSASWLCGAFFVISVSAYYLFYKRSEKRFAEPAMKIALVYAAMAAFAMIVSGHSSSVTVAKFQPEKLAAFEGHYQTETRAPLYLLGWVDEDARKTVGIKIPAVLSFLCHWDFNAEVKGLNDIPDDTFLKTLHPEASKEELQKLRPKYWAHVNFCFQTFRLMLIVGILMCLLIALGFIVMKKGKLAEPSNKLTKIFLILSLPSVILPILGSQIGWALAEVGRQPWTVWHLLKTSSAVTHNASAPEILFSIITFTLLFTLISAVGLKTLYRKISAGEKILKD